MISSLLRIHKLPFLAGSVFWVIQDPTTHMNKTAEPENIPMEWLHNGIGLTWKVERFFHKSKSKWDELNSP